MRKDILTKKALAYLSRDPLLHMSMIFPVRRETAEIRHADEDGVFMYETKSNAYMLSATDFERGRTWLDSVGRHPILCLHQCSFADYVAQRHGYETRLDCYQAVYQKKSLLPVGNEGSLGIHQLRLPAAKEVHSHYHDNADLDYIRERIAEGELYGGYCAGKLCGFIGTHSEGSLGLLYILPEFRRRGFARMLEGYMVNRALSLGLTPFAQITVGNEESLRLSRSLGFDISSAELHWLF